MNVRLFKHGELKALLFHGDWTAPRLFTTDQTRRIAQGAWVYKRHVRSMEGPQPDTRWVYVKPLPTPTNAK